MMTTIQLDVKLPQFKQQAAPEPDQEDRDRMFMQGVKAGDRTCLRLLMQRYWAPLLGYASMMTESGADAEDVVQETFVRVWHYRERWTSAAPVSAYLYRITRNLALNARRDRRAQWNREESNGASLFGSMKLGNPEEDLEAQCLGQDIQLAIDRLPNRRREVFTLVRFHGLSYREIGDALGLSQQTVANHMSCALKDLRRALSAHLDEAGFDTT